MAKIIFSDGQAYESAEAISVYEAAKALYGSVSRDVLAASINGVSRELSTVIDGDAEVKLLTFADEEGKRIFRHTAEIGRASCRERVY